MTTNIHASRFDYVAKTNNSGWKYYNQIKKKAMEQEFSWAGLVLSVSIAFFIVMITAYSLNLLFSSYKRTQLGQKINKQIYSLETFSSKSGELYIQIDKLNPEKIKFENFSDPYLA